MSPPTPGWLRLENRHTGEVLELRRRRHNGETIIDLRGTLPPRSEGPPLHIHHLEDETAARVRRRQAMPTPDPELCPGTKLRESF